jgi:hypothetical protein
MEVRHKSKLGGSDVTHVLGNDHVLAAQKYLEDKGFADQWQVVVADDKRLMLDYDDMIYDSHTCLPDHFYNMLAILEETTKFHQTYFAVTESKGGRTHVIIHLNDPMLVTERIAWQAALGSDPRREALHLLSISRGELNPILLFMRKDRKTTGTDESGNSRIQGSHVTTQKLLGDGNGN